MQADVPPGLCSLCSPLPPGVRPNVVHDACMTEAQQTLVAAAIVVITLGLFLRSMLGKKKNGCACNGCGSDLKRGVKK